jgi:hypothetical protein
MFFVVPLWLAAGVADWLCHRQSKIETNAGYKESLLRLLMMAEVSIPVILVMFCQVKALVLCVCLAGFIAHRATAYWDLGYAVKRRTVKPIEQQVHSFLEIVPLMALTCIVALHWDQFIAMFGFGQAIADFGLRAKQPPLPTAYVAALLVGMVLFEALPFIEELIRCLTPAKTRPLLGRPGRASASP